MVSSELSLGSKILTWCFTRVHLARIFPIFSCSDPQTLTTRDFLQKRGCSLTEGGDRWESFENRRLARAKRNAVEHEAKSVS